MQLADVLKTAIKGEVDGHKFYDLLAQKATNPEAKRKLENLRDDEIALFRSIIRKPNGVERRVDH